MDQNLKIGDRVRWTNPLSAEYENAEGEVVRVTRCCAQFTIYDVQFKFGIGTLFSNQIEPACQKPPKVAGTPVLKERSPRARNRGLTSNTHGRS